MKFTEKEKLQAMALKFYQCQKWEPASGDFYTSTRYDLELYQVVSIDGEKIRTRYVNTGDFGTSTTDWELAIFLTEGFGPFRVHVPKEVLDV